MKIHTLTLATTCGLAALGDAHAQLPPAVIERGAFHSLPVSFLRSLSTTADVEMTASAGLTGLPTVPPAPAPLGYPNAPDYRKAAMFDASDIAWVQIDAMTTGNDNLAVFADGRINLGGNTAGWGVLSFSVTSSSPGPIGSVIAARAADPLVDHGGDIYSIGIPGSLVIDQKYIGTVWLEHAASDIDATNSNFDLQAHDYQAALIVENDGAVDPNLVPNSNLDFYFSLAPSAVANAPVPLPPQSRFHGLTLDAATVYRTTYLAGVWGPITVAWSRQTLGLSAGDNIDALAVRPGDSVIFSTEDPDYDELLCYSNVMQGGSVPLRDPTGVAMSSVIGLRTGPGLSRDNVDAVCGIDPESGLFSDLIGTPVKIGPSATDTMSLSVSRHCDPTSPSTRSLQIALTGWGRILPDDGKVILTVISGVSWDTLTDSLIFNPANIATLPALTRSAAADRFYTTLPLPSASAGTMLVVAQFNGDGGAFEISQPCIMRF